MTVLCWPRSCPLCRLPGLLCLVVLGMLLSGSGCLSFRSITATASVGQMIGPRANIVTILPVFCEAENILSTAEPGVPASCPQREVEAYSRDILRYSQNVAAYASLLSDLAQFDDDRLADPLSRAISGTEFFIDTARGDDPSSGRTLSTSASKVAQLLTQEWRRNRIEELVRSTHPHLDAVLAGLLERVAALGESTKFLAEKDLTTRRRLLEELDRSAPSEPGPGVALSRAQRQAMLLGLLHFQQFAKRSNEGLVEYKKALLAFRRAHTVLYERVSQNRSLLEDDRRVYEELKKDIPPLLK